jgi:adenine-specific DNA-methyltransferase
MGVIFTWDDKYKAQIIANTPSEYEMIPCEEESLNFDTTENIFVEGDNLDALKLLKKKYRGKVKLIYIDPPYNTNKNFLYNDKFSGKIDRHVNWLNMIYPRLKIAKKLLKEDGFIFISIDDNEVHNLRQICNEIFGEKNFLSTIMWKRRSGPVNTSKKISVIGEYIVAYSGSNEYEIKREPHSEANIKLYKKPNDDFPLGKWRSDCIKLSNGLRGGGYKYNITTPSGKIYNETWNRTEKNFIGLKEKNLIYWGEDKSCIPKKVTYLHETNGRVVTNYWDKIAFNREAKKEIIDLFGNAYFDTPKPVNLIKKIINIIFADDKSNDIVLDFFAGSSSTAHAVMQHNAESETSLKFIMVQSPEQCDEESKAFMAGYDTIADISKERIRRAAEKIKAENPEYNGDLGFKVLKLESLKANGPRPQLSTAHKT